MSEAQRESKHAWYRGPWASVGIFLVVAFALHAGLALPATTRWFLGDYTSLVTRLSRGLLSLFLPAVGGQAEVIDDGVFAVRVLNVCNGTDLWVLFTAAVVAFPAPLRSKLAGLAVGLPLLSIINLSRIVGLFLTGRYLPGMFDLSHLFFWQAVLIVATVGVFIVYLKWALPPPPPPARAS